MSSVQETSREAYQETAKKRGTWENAVLGCIRKYGPISDREVAAKLQRECGFVSARRNSLVEQGKVKDAGEYIDPNTNRPVMLWSVV
jgi:hypothetical protein